MQTPPVIAARAPYDQTRPAGVSFGNKWITTPNPASIAAVMRLETTETVIRRATVARIAEAVARDCSTNSRAPVSQIRSCAAAGAAISAGNLCAKCLPPSARAISGPRSSYPSVAVKQAFPPSGIRCPRRPGRLLAHRMPTGHGPRAASTGWRTRGQALPAGASRKRKNLASVSRLT
jgi:hypothetical protein